MSFKRILICNTRNEPDDYSCFIILSTMIGMPLQTQIHITDIGYESIVFGNFLPNLKSVCLVNMVGLGIVGTT